MVTKVYKGLGIFIALMSLLAFDNPDTMFFAFPVVLALGSIVYGMGILMDIKDKTLDSLQNKAPDSSMDAGQSDTPDTTQK